MGNPENRWKILNFLVMSRLAATDPKVKNHTPLWHSPQFGAQNDKHVVKMDDGVDAVQYNWYNTVRWSYFPLARQVSEVLIL